MQSVQPKYGYGMTLSACLWLGLFPLLQGGTYSRITRDKWTAMLILCAVTLFCFLFDKVLLPVLRRKQPPAAPVSGRPASRLLPLVLASALLLWTVLSCVLSENGADVWWIGTSARYEGLATFLCYLGLFFCFLFSRISLKPVLLSAAAGVTVFLVIVLLQRGGGNPLGLYPGSTSYARNPDFQGTIGNVDMGTGYLLILAGLFLQGILGPLFASRERKKDPSLPKPSLSCLIPAAVCLPALLVTLFLILTMGVQFGVVSLGVLCVFTFLRFMPKKWRLPLLILLIVIALAVVWFWPGRSGGVWELHEILHGRARLSFGSNRLAVWYYSLLLSREKPLLGGGSASFESRFNRFLANNGYSIPTEQDGLPLPHYFDMPHNEYIAQLVDHGIPALLLFAALLLCAVLRRRDGWFPLLNPCGAAVLCYAVQAFFSFSVCLVAPMFWVVLALAFRRN